MSSGTHVACISVECRWRGHSQRCLQDDDVGKAIELTKSIGVTLCEGADIARMAG